MSSSGSSLPSPRYWLLKAEPEPRIVKGKDVKFSVDDFERVKTSPWEGVRNYEARNLMKEMKMGDKALFYHSNCKVPGIAGFAEVSKEAYPDYTAWDSSHPYFDVKSDSADPKWFMVDLTFSSRAPHFVPLALLRKISELPPSQVPEEISYIGEKGVKSIKGMDLVTRGRLSVQRVEEGAWATINLLAEKGGWEELDLRPLKKTGKAKEPGAAPPKPKKKPARSPKKRKSRSDDETEADGSDERENPDVDSAHNDTSVKEDKSKRKLETSEDERVGLRRSTRPRR